MSDGEGNNINSNTTNTAAVRFVCHVFFSQFIALVLRNSQTLDPGLHSKAHLTLLHYEHGSRLHFNRVEGSALSSMVDPMLQKKRVFITYLQYFISHGRLDVDLQLRPRHDVHVDDLSKVLELLFWLHVAGLFDVSVQLKYTKNALQKVKKCVCVGRRGRDGGNT